MGSEVNRIHLHSLETKRLGLGSDARSTGLGQEILRKLSLRGLFLCNQGDVVVVNEKPDDSWLEYLRSVGIDCGEIVVADGDAETLAEDLLINPAAVDQIKALIARSNFELVPYMGSEESHAVAELLGVPCQSPPLALLDRLNSKVNLESVLKECELPTIQASYASQDELERACSSLFGKHGPLIVRSDLSIGGHGVWSIKSSEDIDELSQATAQTHADQQFVIQPLLDVVNSPNVQFEICENEVVSVGLSDQTMTERFAFGGNTYPSVSSENKLIHEQSQKLVQWLQSAGYRGMVGIDFIVVPSGDVFIIEINPRVNTSTFPLVLSNQLGRSAFELCTGLEVGSASQYDWIDVLSAADLLYSKERGFGLIPLMIPTKDRPALDAMIFADSLSSIRLIRAELLKVLQATIPWTGSEA